MKAVKAVLALCTFVLARTSKGESGWGNDCPALIRSADLDPDNFNEAIAHGVHSLTIEDIRDYFSPDAPEDVGVPNLNFNLTDDYVLRHPQKAHYDPRMRTIGLKTMDFIYSNNSPSFYQKGFTAAEKLAHAFHMHEIWHEARDVYKTLDLAKLDPRLCPCLLDVEKNRILHSIQSIGEFMTWVRGTDEERRRISYAKKKGGGGFSYTHYEFHYGGKDKELRQDPVLESRRLPRRLMNDDVKMNDDVNGMPSLAIDGQNWLWWREMLVARSMPDDQEILALAVFLRCALA